MNVTLIRPESEFLRKYIQYFFFIENSSEDYDKTHICYPNTNYCLGLYKGNRLVRQSEVDFRVLQTQQYRSYLTGIYQKPINVRYRGSFKEVCIDFEPLGLEMLTGVKISNNDYIPDAVEVALPQYKDEIYELAFGSESPANCAANLEKLFLRKIPSQNPFDFVGFNDLRVNQVDDLKAVHHKSYRSIHRFYRGALDLSPKEFLNLRRFRRAVSQIHRGGFLTNVAYDQGFSDQAHMTREFKRYSGLSPKAFRSQSSLVDETLCWTRK